MPKRRAAGRGEAIQLSLNFDGVIEEPARSSPRPNQRITSQEKLLILNSGAMRYTSPKEFIKPLGGYYSAKYLKTLQNWYRQSWGEVFYDALPLSWTSQHLDPLLGGLKERQARGSYLSAGYPLNIHRLEKDLTYLAAIAINKKVPLFLNFPVTPVSIGILTIAYYATLSREERDLISKNHAITSKSFVLWIRPHDNGKIQKLIVSRSPEVQINLNEQLVCIPAYRFEESAKDTRIRVATARALSEGIDLLHQSKYCSLVVLDDPSGQTCLSSFKYGSEVFEIARDCQKRNLPMIGIVPPWAMHQVEHYENSNRTGILLWPIDSGALRSYPVLPSPYARNKTSHPIEESYRLLNKKCEFGAEPQITIRTFSFSEDDENRIAEGFQEALDLLVTISKKPELKSVWIKGWEIWRELTAPILPAHLLWEKFLQGSMKQLETAVERCNTSQASALFRTLNSLTQRFQKLTQNPFLKLIESLNSHTTIAVTDIAHADALRKFLAERSYASQPKVLAINELRGQIGEKLVVVGQPKARHRDLIQTTFFRHVEVLLWAVFADRAKFWWSGLEIDSRIWHAKTWHSLTDQEFGGRYDYSHCSQPVQVVHSGKTRLRKSIDISKLEETLSEVGGTSLDSGLTSSDPIQLNTHYLVELNNPFKIRVSPNSEFLVLSRGQVRVVSVRDITAGTKVVLFEGMNRDELFAQKAGLLEESRDNWLYRVQLEGWRTLVKQCIEQLDAWTVSRQISRSTGSDIGEEAVCSWMNGDDLLTLPREKEHFLWFLPALARSSFEEFWRKANNLREKRRQLGRVISACAQEGWKERNANEIVFQYQKVFITVGELREAMQVLEVKSTPQHIQQKPAYPFNRLFRHGE